MGGHSFVFTILEHKNLSADRGKIIPDLLLDKWATSHIINDKTKFVGFDQKFNSSTHFIELADGSRPNVVLGKGNAKVKLCAVFSNLQDVVLNNALYTLSYKQNIFLLLSW